MIANHPAPLVELAPPADTFAADVRRGLRAAPKSLPCKYFYDAAGSELFDRICELPEYYLTRAELAILNRHATEMAGLLGPRCTLIEFGSGSGIKTRLLLDQLTDPAAYVPVDIAREHLTHSAARLARDYPHVRVYPVCADFTRPLDLTFSGGRRAVFFPGSTVGNFPPEEAVRLLRQVARLVSPGGGLILGTDRKKDPRVIEAAYNDRAGVTAAFNLNLLRRINRELGADFAVEEFWHHALYNPGPGRIEMHLVSRREQVVRLGGDRFRLAEGEPICTEFSHKYSAADVRRLAEDAGFTVRQTWLDPEELFAVHYLTVGL
jgi:dimethylhistidine N-methyltransferase